MGCCIQGFSPSAGTLTLLQGAVWQHSWVDQNTRCQQKGGTAVLPAAAQLHGRKVLNPPFENPWVSSVIGGVWASQPPGIFGNGFLQLILVSSLVKLRVKIMVLQLRDTLCTWKGWSWILHLLYTTDSWMMKCVRKKCRTDFVQVGYSAPLERHPLWLDSVWLCDTWRFICHNWWQWGVCVYTPLLLFTSNVLCFAFCRLSFLHLLSVSCLLSSSWGQKFSPANSSKKLRNSLYVNNTDESNCKEKWKWWGSWYVRCEHKERQVFSTNVPWNNTQLFCINSISVSNHRRPENSSVDGCKMQHGMTESGRLTLRTGITCFAWFYVP